MYVIRQKNDNHMVYMIHSQLQDERERRREDHVVHAPSSMISYDTVDSC